MIQVALAVLFGFAVLTFWIPAYWPVTAFQVGVFTLAGVILLRAFRFSARLNFPFFPLSVAVAWGLLQISTGRTVYGFETTVAVLRWATFLAVFFVSSNIFLERSARERFSTGMLWFTVLFAAFATVQAFSSGGKVFWTFETQYPTVMGTILSPNHFAAFVEAVLPIALYRALRSHSGALPYLAMSAVMLASIIASGSRAGAILTLAEVVVVFVLVRIRSRSSAAETFGALGKILLMFTVFVAVVGWQRVWDKFMAPDPMAVRREFALSTVAMIRANPWFGVGLGNWPTAYPKFAIVDVGTFANQAHNDWLQWAAEGGIPFAIVIASIFVWAVPRAFRSIWGIGVIAVFLHALVDYPFSRPALGAWPFLLMGMLACLTPGQSNKPRSRGADSGREPQRVCT